jgi:predicted flap endonuclease-1-like 5' DNA nuclease
VSFRKKLSEAESTSALVVGGGLALFMIGFLLSSAQASKPDFDVSRLNLVMIVGGILSVAGVVGWLVATQPWHNFDDWSTPAFTGHAHHDEHEVHTESSAAGHAVEGHESYGAPAPSAPSIVAVSALTGGADDLKAIEGIGPKIATALNGVGIRTFADLAERDPNDVERIVRDAGVRMVGHAGTWIEQAKLAASGKMTELEALQKQLRAGSRPRRS